MTDGVQFAAFLCPEDVGDFDLARAVLISYIRWDVERGRIKLLKNWELTGITSELVESQWGSGSITCVRGIVYGAQVVLRRIEDAKPNPRHPSTT